MELTLAKNTNRQPPFDLKVTLTTNRHPRPVYFAIGQVSMSSSLSPRFENTPKAYREEREESGTHGDSLKKITDHNALLSDGQVQLRVYRPCVSAPRVRASTRMHLESMPRDTTLDNNLREIRNTADVSGG